MSGQQAEGIKYLRQAVSLNRSTENLSSLAEALDKAHAKPDGTAAEEDEAISLLQEANQKAQHHDADVLALMAIVEIRQHQSVLFAQTVRTMKAEFPHDMRTHVFLGLQAAYEQRWIQAENEIRQAHRLGLPAAMTNSLLAGGIHRMATIYRTGYALLGLFCLWLLGFPLLYIIGRVMSNLTLSSIETADPNVGPNPQELRLRNWYRYLIIFAGSYYYLSIPFVIVLVLACAAGILLFFMWIGMLPIKLLVIVAIVALVTIFQSIRSLFLRFSDTEAGRPLRGNEAPEFWQLVCQVAHTVGTRAVDEIRVLPGTEMAVYERGRRNERRQDHGKRVLLLGIGLLHDFEQSAFRAVLAHEYGHFSHRDTAGGDIAIRTNATMMMFAIGMVRHGVAVVWNIGFQFLRLYHFIFRRISYGATRLQEVLADRVAVLNYGAPAFEAGLRHVIRRSAAFDAIAEKEVTDAINAKRVVVNLYTLPAESSDELERQVEAEFTRSTTADDTHPSPADRFRLAQRIQSATTDTSSAQLWDLFRDREGLEREMCTLINEQITKKTGITLLAEATPAVPAE